MKFVFSLIAIIVIVLLARRKLIVYQRGDIVNKPNIGGTITEGQVGGFIHNFLNNPTHWSKIFETVQEPYLVTSSKREDFGGYQTFNDGFGGTYTRYVSNYQNVPDNYIAYSPVTNYYWKNSETLAKILTTKNSTTTPTFP